MSKDSNIVLEAKGVEKSFSSPGHPIHVLRGVDLQLKRGESLSIRGESGVGKTTLLNTITLLERPDKGEIIWAGKRMDQCRNSNLAHARGNLIGLIFQMYYLVPELNAIENVLLARRIIGKVRPEDIKRAKYLLDTVGVSKRIDHLPTQLSGGEAQRVGIARALLNNPEVVIADEPTGNLDEKTAEVVMDILLKMCKEENTGLILVTHNPEYAARTQRQSSLLHGKLKDNEK